MRVESLKPPPQNLTLNQYAKMNKSAFTIKEFFCFYKYAKKFHGLVALFLVSTSLTAFSQSGGMHCGALENHYGPYDYRTAGEGTRSTVERAHFTTAVESLAGGVTSATAGGDMNYTLKVFPNHHRALMAVIKLAEKEKKERPRDMEYSVACWFERAERFKPDDAMVKAIHGTYLIRSGKQGEAVKKLEEAAAMAGDNSNISYNLGLAYFDLKQYDKALESAHRAYELGFPLPGLRNKLKQAGKWRDASPSGKEVSENSADPSK